MTKRMLIDTTHPEETRVALVNGTKLDEYDYETLVRKQLKSNIYLVKVTRVEPSLQAAFVDFGGNRHGFLPFPEVHPDYYRIPIADREALLAEERAIAAAQAAREDAEDAAELAASGEKLDDDEEPEIEEGSEEEGYAPRPAGSLASAIATAEISDAAATTDQIEDEAEDEEEENEEEENEDDDAGEESESTQDSSDADKDESEETEGEAAPSVETLGGDSSDSSVFRSSIKRRYKIQEVIKRNQIMLIQISKEERGNKGAAVTTFISLPGRYCVLMPNSPRGGGVSRKVSNAKDRQRLKQILRELNVPEGMSVILRTAGVAREKAEIKRDLDYLLRLWDQIRELTLKSTAPALVYEEGNLIKRAIRDLYRRDIDEVLVAGEDGHKNALEFMKTLMPTHAQKVMLYQENIPLFSRYQVESQIDAIHSPTVHLKSGGYIVINPTEALVSIDVNSGRATKGRHIEETALKTNLEAAEEIARQLRLRDQGGLIVIDFIDMEDRRSNRIVEKRLRDAMQTDRARIQLGRISAFGLLELSRQRLHPSLVETNFETCKHCAGTGLVRTVETSAVMALRAIEEEGIRGRAAEIKVRMPAEVALYIFNHKREMLAAIEKRHTLRVFIHADDTLLKPDHAIEVLRASGIVRDMRPRKPAPVQSVEVYDLPEDAAAEMALSDEAAPAFDEMPRNVTQSGDGDHGRRERHGHHGQGRHRDRGDRGGDRGGRHNNRHRRPYGEARADGAQPSLVTTPTEFAVTAPASFPAAAGDTQGDADALRGGAKRRGRRGGRRRGGRNGHLRDGLPNPDLATAEQPRVSYDQQPSPALANPPSSRPADSSAPQPPSSSEGESGNARKGWWKRLTE